MKTNLQIIKSEAEETVSPPKTQFATDGGHIPKKLKAPYFKPELVKNEPDGLLRKRIAELKRNKVTPRVELGLWDRIIMGIRLRRK